MVKTTSILNLNRDENQMIFKNVFEFRLQISRSRDPPVCALSHMAIIVPIWDGVKTGGASTANEIRSRLPFENTHLSMKINISDATRSPIMLKTTSILNLNRDENQMIFKNVFEFRLQISRSRDPPVCALSHMAIIVPIWDGVKTGGASTANEIRSRLPFENTHLSMKINISDATRSPIWACPKTGGS